MKTIEEFKKVVTESWECRVVGITADDVLEIGTELKKKPGKFVVGYQVKDLGKNEQLLQYVIGDEETCGLHRETRYRKEGF